VAFIFSAKAGPARAMAVPSASVASMILVFDMVFSLWAFVGVPISKQPVLDFIPANDINGWQFSTR
jgi:hypothetical protein